MQRFSRLYNDLDRTTKTNAKVAAMVAYFQNVPAEDAAWAVFFLTGQRLKRLISGKVLRDWALKASGLPEWLVIDAHAAVGDSAETVSLLLDRGHELSLIYPWTKSTNISDGLPRRLISG
jgi:DNA ligase-1